MERCGFQWLKPIGCAGHLVITCDLPAGHGPMHSAPDPDLPRLYYVEPDATHEAVNGGQCYHAGEGSLK